MFESAGLQPALLHGLRGGADATLDGCSVSVEVFAACTEHAVSLPQCAQRAARHRARTGEALQGHRRDVEPVPAADLL